MQVTATLSPARALHRPHAIDWRAVLGLFVGLVALAGSVAYWSLTSSDSRPVVVATRDLPAGSKLKVSDLAVIPVRLDDATYAAAIPGDNVDTLVGKQLGESAHARQLLVPAQVSPRPAMAANQIGITIPVGPDTAMGGNLSAGSRVRILATTDKDTPQAHTSVVLPSAIVYDLGYDQSFSAVNTDLSGSAPPRGPIKWVALLVSPDDAVRLAEARWSGPLDVTLLPPGSS